MGPKTTYAKSNGVSIAYQLIGDGPFDIVLVPGFVSNVELYWENPGWAHIFDRLTSFARLILWDKRGTGLSDPVERVPTLDERAQDLLAVMDAAQSERAALFGISEGGPMGLVFAATHPERVRSLVLYGTTPRFSRTSNWEWGFEAKKIEGWLAEIEQHWGDGVLLDLFAPSQADDEAVRQIWGRVQRAGASPAMARAVMEAFGLIDCREVLPAIRVPTLLLHRRGDRVASVEAARYMAEHIGGARLVEFPGENHLITLGDLGPILDEIERFLTGTHSLGPIDRVLATVLFTDIVGSTARAADLGDHGWRRVLENHNAVVRSELERFGGREVKAMGDGFLATFTAPSRAIACACAIRDAIRSLGIEIRAGLHTGECEMTDADVTGLAVHIGARVAALAQAGEVLMSSTVKDLVAGSGLKFVDRGEHALKGVPGKWTLFAVKP